MIDPAIEGARVNIVYHDNGSAANVCGGAGTAYCEDWTDSDGHFDFVMPENIDTTNLRVTSVGGKDVLLGTDFTTISLSSLSTDKYEVDGKYSIIVSPVTTLANSLLIKNYSEEDISTILGVDYSNVMANPLENKDVARASYFLTRLQASDNSVSYNNIVQNISTVNNLFSNSLMDILYSDDKVASTMKTLIASILAQDFSDIESGLKELAITELVELYMEKAVLGAMSNLPDNSSDYSDNFSNSIKTLLKYIESETGEAIVVQYATVSILYDLLVAGNYLFGDYHYYTNDAIFGTMMSEMIAIEYIKTSIITMLQAATVRSIKTPLTTLIAQDNTELFNYYISTDINNAYAAQSMANRIMDDSVTSAIHSDATLIYALYGLYDIAYAYTNAFITDPTTRAKTIIEIARYRYSAGETDAALDMYEEANTILLGTEDAAFESGSSTVTSYIYASVALYSSYQNIGEKEKAAVAMQRLRDVIETRLDSTTTPTRGAAAAQIIAPLGNVAASFADGDTIREKVERGEYQAAIDQSYLALDALEFLDYINTKYPGEYAFADNIITMYTIYNIGYLGTSVINDSTVAESGLVAMAAQYDLLMAHMTSTVAFILGNGYAGLVLLKGQDYIDTTFYEACVAVYPSMDFSDAKAAGVRQTALVLAMDNGFDSAKAYLEGYNTLQADNETSLQTYTTILTYYNETTPGIASMAIDYGKTDVATAALAYITEIVDNNTSLYSSSNPIATATASNQRHLLTTAVGYARIAELYIKLGMNAEAISVLDKAVAWNDTATPSQLKHYSYGMLGYLYSLAGNTDKSNAEFNKAVNMDTTFTIDNLILSEMSLGVVHDYIYRGDSNSAKAELVIAASYASAYNAVATSTTTVIAAMELYVLIAGYYHQLGDEANRDATLSIIKDNTAKATGITEANRASYYMTYYLATMTVFGYSELAYTEAASIFSIDITNFNSAVSAIATALLELDAFPDSDIAFSDIDGDGQPDFFVPWATEYQITASGLTLDTDCDNDGKLNHEDATPFFAD